MVNNKKKSAQRFKKETTNKIQYVKICNIIKTFLKNLLNATEILKYNTAFIKEITIFEAHNSIYCTELA